MTKRLMPAPGRTVPQEDGSPWPADGLPVTSSRYIRRRLADGDLIEVASKRAAAETADSDPGSGEPPAGEDEGGAPGDAETKNGGRKARKSGDK